ncbi:MAG: cytochrome c maturation protein CcmE [Actinomycetes bacterium]|jgi:cytochrome c-type biogenesis protein CcmE|nr:cytochrome c maturation protein CcmE [Actinomycetes bacterium]
MNNRARNRLIGIAVILVVVIAAALVFFSKGSAYNLTIAQVIGDTENNGKRVKVSGTVVDGSWDKKTNPMTFMIAETGDDSENPPELTVVYTGALPATFGDGVEAIVTGEYDADTKTVTSGEMITKCPSKYESSDDAYQVTQLKERADAMVNVPVRVAGVVKDGSVVPPGGAVRFVILNAEGATDELNVSFDGALSDDVKDGAHVVLTGELDQNGAFYATEVALEK